MSSVPSQVSKYMGNAVKLAEIWGTLVYNVKSIPYLAKGDDSHVDTTNIQQAINAAAVNGGVVAFPPGTYITGSLTVPSNVTLWFTNGAILSVNSGATLTINGSIDAEFHKIFGGLGTVGGNPKNEYIVPQWFGAKGDGGTDDTSAIQKSLNLSLSIKIPQGVYMLTATLTGRPNQVITGDTPETCQFLRTTAYGHTLVIGADVAVDNSDHAGAAQVTGIWFHHIYTFNNGSSYVPGTSTNITNKDPNSTHLKITQGQHVRIRDCWFYGIGHGIECIDTTIIWVERCDFNGMWDKNVVGLQDSTSAIYLHASASDRRCGILNVTSCHIGGYAAGAPVNVTTGNVTVSKSLNAGQKYGIFIQSCERFDIYENYIGGQSYHNIYLSATAIIGHGNIHDNMIDSAGEYSVLMEALSNLYYPNFINVHHNTGVGYGLDQGFLRIKDTGFNLMASQIVIDSNIVQMYLRAAISLEKCKGIKLSNNVVAAYNTDGATSPDDPFLLAGCVSSLTTSYVDSIGNTWGGSINVPGGTNNCKWGLFFYTTTNNTSALERSAGLGLAGGVLVAGISQTYPT